MEALKRNKIWKLITKLYDFDVEAKNLGIKVRNDNRAFVVYVIRLFMMQLTMISICGTLLSFQFQYYGLILKFYVSYVLMDTCYTTTFCIYNYFVFNFWVRFKYINDTLQDVLNMRDLATIELDSQISGRRNESDLLNVLNKLADLYYKLTICMRLLSESYSVQITFIAAVVFQFTLVCAYMVYQICLGSYTTNSLLVTYAYSMRTFYFYSQILYATVYGTKLSSEVSL
ncbi:hypothetical protein Bhyg_13905 [Pseudolycoriella hygida]|uniref:Uncharacterized protein n=1 Tax=Pseudolycoriella hygida TaxID=35572 RepID=A0A9Q0RV49_9DIPT|nr:hypothetical protein Bhyg_13905 [Pseudolycoriella hygida]